MRVFLPVNLSPIGLGLRIEMFIFELNKRFSQQGGRGCQYRASEQHRGSLSA